MEVKLNELRRRFASAPEPRPEPRCARTSRPLPSACEHCGRKQRQIAIAEEQQLGARARFEMATTRPDQFEVQWEPARTAYVHFDGDEDPNSDRALCRACAEKHHEYWDEQWDDYNRNLL